MAKKSPKKSSNTQRSSRYRYLRTRALANAPHRSSAAFGVTAEGAMLVNIDALDAVDVADLKTRKLFIGVELPGHERAMARRLLDEAGHTLGARIGGAIAPRRAAKSSAKAG